MDKIPSFLKMGEGDSVIFNGDGELRLYVPVRQFELNAAFQVGEYFSVVGLFNYALYDKNEKLIKFDNFDCPTRFITKPTRDEKINGVRLTKNSMKASYRVLIYKKGSVLFTSRRVPQLVENAEQFVNLLITTGNIPNTIPYDKIQEYIIENADMNGFSYNVNIQMLAMLISVICRDKKDITKPFRLAKTNDMHAYTTISVKEAARIADAYSAFISENIDESLVAATLADPKSNRNSTTELVLMGEDYDDED